MHSLIITPNSCTNQTTSWVDSGIAHGGGFLETKGSISLAKISYFHTFAQKKREDAHNSTEVDGQLINHPQQIRESVAELFEMLFTGDGVNFNPDDLANFFPYQSRGWSFKIEGST